MILHIIKFNFIQRDREDILLKVNKKVRKSKETAKIKHIKVYSTNSDIFFVLQYYCRNHLNSFTFYSYL